ncbi:hypothetical protein DsansV1_C21g0167791 [Dioscorea sansibarensis]
MFFTPDNILSLTRSDLEAKGIIKMEEICPANSNIIGNLAAEIKEKILLFSLIRDAVVERILSMNWRYVWTSRLGM